jgi:hypothetical protein
MGSFEGERCLEWWQMRYVYNTEKQIGKEGYKFCYVCFFKRLCNYLKFIFKFYRCQIDTRQRQDHEARTRGMAQVVELLPSKSKALNSNTSTNKRP